MDLTLASATSTASPRPSRARSARRTSPAKRARPAWPPKAPARTRRASWARAGRFPPRSASRPRRTFTLAEIKGPGCIQQIWMTPTGNWRRSILRFYWDDETEPSVECPVGDFFACGWGKYCQINSLAVCVNPGSAFNCYWQMPFRKKARITMENVDEKDMTLYYQINYTLTEVPKDAAYFHAQFRRESPLQPEGHLHHPGRRQGPGPIRRHLPGVGGAQPRLVGRGRDQVLHGWRQGIPDHLRHRHGGLLLRLLQLREPRDQEIPGVLARPTPAWRKSSRRTRSTRSASGLACTAGTFPIRSASRRTSRSPSRRWAGRKAGATCSCEDDIASVAYWYQKEPHRKFPKLPEGL